MLHIKANFTMTVSGIFQTYTELLRYMNTINPLTNLVYNFSISIEKQTSMTTFVVSCSFITEDYGEQSIMNCFIDAWEGEGKLRKHNCSNVMIDIDKSSFTYITENDEVHYVA